MCRSVVPGAGASMVGLQCPHGALATPAPCDFHYPLSALLVRSTDVFWPVIAD